MCILRHPARGTTSLALFSSLPLLNGRSTGIYLLKIHCSVGLRSREPGNPSGFNGQMPHHSLLKERHVNANLFETRCILL